MDNPGGGPGDPYTGRRLRQTASSRSSSSSSSSDSRSRGGGRDDAAAGKVGRGAAAGAAHSQVIDTESGAPVRDGAGVPYSNVEALSVSRAVAEVYAHAKPDATRAELQAQLRAAAARSVQAAAVADAATDGGRYRAVMLPHAKWEPTNAAAAGDTGSTARVAAAAAAAAAAADDGPSLNAPPAPAAAGTNRSGNVSAANLFIGLGYPVGAWGGFQGWGWDNGLGYNGYYAWWREHYFLRNLYMQLRVPPKVCPSPLPYHTHTHTRVLLHYNNVHMLRHSATQHSQLH